MTKVIVVTAALAALAWVAAASVSPTVSGNGSLPVRTFELTYTALIRDLPATAAKVEIWLPRPASDASQQVEVEEVASPYPMENRKEAKLGNGILHFVAEHPERAEIALAMTIRVRRSALERKSFGVAQAHWHGRLEPAVAYWLGPDRLVPNDERIRSLAQKVTAGRKTDLEKARAIYEYVVATMSYDKQGTGWGNGDIYWACDAKRGNCTDFHALFTGLARAVGIPAKFEIGFPVPPEHGEGKIGGYHCWSEFYLAGYGWVPIDASEARKHPEKKDYYFGALDEDRVKFSEGRDLMLDPPQKGEPLNYFVYPYVEVDGKPYKAVDLTFTYRDLPAEGEARATQRR
jgi:transglutaminase-like putative cysteine protease